MSNNDSLNYDLHIALIMRFTIPATEPGVPYNITVRASTAAGKGEPVSIVVFSVQQGNIIQVTVYNYIKDHAVLMCPFNRKHIRCAHVSGFEKRDNFVQISNFAIVHCFESTVHGLHVALYLASLAASVAEIHSLKVQK